MAERGEVWREGNSGIMTMITITITTKMGMYTEMAIARANQDGDRVQMHMKRCQRTHLRRRNKVRKVRRRIDESLEVIANETSTKPYCVFGQSDEIKFGV